MSATSAPKFGGAFRGGRNHARGKAMCWSIRSALALRLGGLWGVARLQLLEVLAEKTPSKKHCQHTPILQIQKHL